MTQALKWWLSIAGLSGMVAVALGAYGAHALKGMEAELIGRFDTALRYHFIHALALLLAVILALWTDTHALRVARWAFLAGLVLFCGSLYGSSLSGGAWSTRTAPAGGILFMIGWLSVTVHAWMLPATD